jgi:hypothetical protein
VKRGGGTEQNREQFAISFLLFWFGIIRIRGAVHVSSGRPVTAASASLFELLLQPEPEGSRTNPGQSNCPAVNLTS